MDDPGGIVGFKIARARMDEIDILPKNMARAAWNKIIARMRLVLLGVVNSIGVTITPLGSSRSFWAGSSLGPLSCLGFYMTTVFHLPKQFNYYVERPPLRRLWRRSERMASFHLW